MSKDLDKQVSQIGHDTFNAAAMAVKQAMVRVCRETGSRNGADALRATLYGGLGALVPCALVIAKRDLPGSLEPPATIDDVTKEHGDYMYSLARPETLTFAALVLAQMLDKMTFETTSISFGPIQLREALEQWKKLFPLHKPEDWIEPHIVNCVKQMEEQASVPVEELMTKLRKAGPSSPTVH